MSGQFQRHVNEFANGNLGAATTLDFHVNGIYQSGVLNSATPCALTFSAPRVHTKVYFECIQDATGGRPTPTFPGSVVGTVPPLNAAANASTLFELLWNGTNYQFTQSAVTSTSGVTTFNSRAGTVTPTTGDYAASQITNDSSVTGTGVKGALNTLLSSIGALVTGVSSAFGRTGAVVATPGDYAASQVTNDSTVIGTGVSGAINTLKAQILALVASLIGNDSSVTGTTVKDALNTLKTSITALVTGVSSVYGRTGAVVAAAGDTKASFVNNDSATVGGTHVSDALDNLLLEYQSAPVVTTNYTFVLADAAVIQLANSAGGLTYTVPANATVAFKIGTRLSVLGIGTGAVSFAGAVGVSFDISGTLPTAQFTLYHLDKIDTNTWLISASGALSGVNVINDSVISGVGVKGALNTIDARFAADEPYLMKGDVELAMSAIASSGWNWQSAGGWTGQGTTGTISISVGPAPIGATITGIRVRVCAVSHSNLPAIMPNLYGYSQDPIASTSPHILAGGPVTDSSGSTGAYASPHDIVLTGFSLPVTSNSTMVWLVLVDEGGANSLSGLKIVSATMTLS